MSVFPETDLQRGCRWHGNLVEIFKIKCLTCQAALSVRNESLLGQIVACPRCGSMVEVAPVAEGTATEDDQPEVPAAESLAPVESAGISIVAWSSAALVLGLGVIATVALWPEQDTTVPAPVAQQQPQEIPVPTMEPPAQLVEETSLVESPKPVATQEPVAATEVAQQEREPEPIADEPPEPEPVVEEVERTAVVGASQQREFDALDFDPESLDLQAIETEPEQPAPTDVVATRIAEPGPPEIEQFVQPQFATLPSVRLGAQPSESWLSREARQQFSQQLPALEVRNMPLVNCLQLLSGLGGVPITVGAEQLQMAGISARERVTLEAKNITLDGALTQLLKPLKLEHHYEGAHVVVRRQSLNRVRSVDYPIDDLVSSAEEGENLAQQIKRLVSPGSWEDGSVELAGDKLKVRQAAQVQFRLLVFFERLRLVRGQVARSRFPVAKLAPTPLHAAMSQRLSGPALFTFSHETPLAEVFQHWQREIDVPVLVDWAGLAELDLTVNTPLICAADKSSWEAALTEVLKPLGLEWRVSFGGSIEISSSKRFREHPQLELYPLGGDLARDPQELLKELAEHLSSLSASDGPSESALEYDVPSRSIIALQPARLQRALLDWLRQQDLLR